MMRNKLLLLAACAVLALTALTASADDDVTLNYSNALGNLTDASEWSADVSGSNFQAQSNTTYLSAPFFEWWKSSTNSSEGYVMYRTATLPAGTYTLKAQVYHNGSGNVYLQANDSSVAITGSTANTYYTLTDIVVEDGGQGTGTFKYGIYAESGAASWFCLGNDIELTRTLTAEEFAEEFGEDVTSTYIPEAGFENCTASSGGGAVSVSYTGEGWSWTHYRNNTSYGAGAVLAYGTSTYVGNSGYYVPSASWDSETNSDNKNALGVQERWACTSYYTSQTDTLPAGTYTMVVHTYNACTNKSQVDVTDCIGFVPSSGDASYCSSVYFVPGIWSEALVTFTLDEDTPGAFRLGYGTTSANSASSHFSPELFFDDVTLYYLAPETYTYADVTSGLLANADFSEGEALEEGVCTYDRDMSTNGVEHYGLQEVDGWTANYPTDNTYDSSRSTSENAHAGGVYAYGDTTAWLGSSGRSYCPPGTDPDGSSDGQCLGIVTVWSSTSLYQSGEVTLPAGSYTIYIPTYNSAGTGSITNYTGFVSSDGSLTQYCTATSYSVGEWTTDSVEFTFTQAVTGHFQFGFKSSNGSSSTPHLFYDGMTVYSTAEAGVGVTTIDPAYDADANALGTATVTFRSWNSDDTAAGALNDQLTLALIAGTDTTSYDLTATDEAGVYTADLSSVALEYETEYTLSIAAGIYGYDSDLTNCAASTTFTTRPDSITLSIGTSGWTSTYYGSYNLTVPDSVTAYTVAVQDDDDDTVTALASPISSGVIPKGTAVLLQGTANTSYTFAIADEAEELTATNDLKGSDGGKVIASSDTGNYYYKFSLDSDNSDGSIGFYWQADDGHSYTATAHKAYLVIEAATDDDGTTEAKAVTFVVDGQTTAITSVNTDAAQAAQGIYTLTGVKLNADIEALPAGLYIINGQKTLIR